MKVYIVTQGEYSDYSIQAAFSTREKAEEYRAAKPSEYRIEEYELDSEPPRVYGPRWGVALRLDGSRDERYCFHAESEEQTEIRRQGERGSGHTSAGFYDERRTKGDGLAFGWFSGVSYVSAEHAMKLAVEQRQKALREHPEWFRVPAVSEGVS